MKNSHFFAMLSRMRFINRWGLMNNTKNENISEHSLQVAMYAYHLVLIHNKNSQTKLNAERAALLGIYHDASEIITGDMPTPVKYYNKDIVDSYKAVEKMAQEKLSSMMVDDYKEYYNDLLTMNNDEDRTLEKYVKAADKLSALVKCIEEIKMGNQEFKQAQISTMNSLKKMNMTEVDEFIEVFIPSFSLTLDEQNAENLTD